MLKGLRTLSGGVGGLGIMIPAVILGAIFLGIRIDTILGSTPFIMIGMVLLSIPAVVFLIIFVSRKSTDFDN